jgi:uncharacterized protein RhaS with RHS repeats
MINCESNTIYSNINVVIEGLDPLWPDPTLGRFINGDPLGFAGGDVNFYVYVQNNPVNFIDPDGEFKIVVGGVLSGFSISGTLYDSEKGFFPDQDPDINVTTTLIGGGSQIVFDKDPCGSISSSEEDIFVSYGIGKYTGYSHNKQYTRSSINVGLSFGSPISFDTSVENFINKLFK